MPSYTLQFINKFKHNRVLKKLFLNYLHFDQNINMPNDIWESFKIARDRLYPENKITQWTSVYSASIKQLEGQLSKFQVSGLAKKGVIRTNENGELAFEDVELVKLLIQASDVFKKEGFLVEGADIEGKRVLAVFPMESKKTGKTILESQTEAVASVLNNIFIKEWAKEMNK